MLDVMTRTGEMQAEIAVKARIEYFCMEAEDNFGKCVFSQCLERGCLNIIACAERQWKKGQKGTDVIQAYYIALLKHGILNYEKKIFNFIVSL